MQKLKDKIIAFFKRGKTKTDNFVFKVACEGIYVVEDLKRLVSKPFFDGLVTVTPNNVDNVALPIVRATLDEIIKTVKVAESCKLLPTEEERLKCFVSRMKDLHKEELNKLCLEIAAWYFKKRQEKNNQSIGLSSAKNEVQKVFDELRLKGKV